MVTMEAYRFRQCYEVLLRKESGPPNENVVQNYLNIALLNVF